MERPPERLLTPAFVALSLSELAYFTAGGLLIGLTPFFVKGPLGGDESGIGLAAAAFAVSTLALRPYAGSLSDRRGRRPLLVGGAALAIVVLLGHLVVTSLPALLVLRLLWGVAEAFYFVAGFAALVDIAPKGRMGEAQSINSLSLYVGLALGPVLGEVLLNFGGFTAAWIGGGVLAVAATLLALRIPETATLEHAADAERPRTRLVQRQALGPGLAMLGGSAAMSGFLFLVGPYAEGAGLDAWSLTFLLFSGVVIGLRLLFSTIADRVPPLRLGAAALALAASGLVVAGLGGVVPLLLGTALLAAGVAFMTPAMFTAAFSSVPPRERGAAAGTMTFLIDLGFGVGPFLMGFVAAGSGTPLAFVLGAGMALAASVGLAVAARTVRRRAAALGP